MDHPGAPEPAVIAMTLIALVWLLVPFTRLVGSVYNGVALMALGGDVLRFGWEAERIVSILAWWGAGWWAGVIRHRSVTLRIIVGAAQGCAPTEGEDIRHRVHELVQYHLAAPALVGRVVDGHAVMIPTRLGRCLVTVTR